MRKIRSSEAKAHFSKILDDVRPGETIVVTRPGREVAPIALAGEQRKSSVAQAVTRIKELQKKNGRITVEEILSARGEGRQ